MFPIRAGRIGVTAGASTPAATVRRLTGLALARYAVFCACMAAAYGMGLQDVASPSGLDAPELSEPPVAPFVNGRPVVRPDWSAVLPYGAWGGCNGPCGETVGVIDDEAPPVPLPGAAWLMLAGLGAVVVAKWKRGWPI